MIPVKDDIARDAQVKSLDEYRALYRRSIQDPEGFWREQSRRLTWFHEPAEVGYWDYERVDFSWYEGGKLNVAWNCVDRHVQQRPEKTAIIVIDMWDDHWCKSAARRVGELAGPLNGVLEKARAKGVFIIHAPSRNHRSGAAVLRTGIKVTSSTKAAMGR